MAKIKEMLSEALISGFKGVVDYYYWLGIPVARRWPRSPGHRRSPAVEAQWLPFATAVALWNELPPELRITYTWMASGTGLSDRDMFIKCYLAGFPKTIVPI